MTTIIWIAIIHEVAVFGFLFFAASRIGKLKAELKISKINEDEIKGQYANLLKTFERYRVALAKSISGEFAHIELHPDSATEAKPAATGNVP